MWIFTTACDIDCDYNSTAYSEVAAQKVQIQKKQKHMVNHNLTIVENVKT